MSIAFLDADFVIKTSAVTNNSNESLLDKVLGLNHDFYICDKVLSEIKINKENIIISRILNKSVKKATFLKIMTLLNKHYKTLYKKVFLSDLKDIIFEMFGEYKLYEDNFAVLEEYLNKNTTVKEFCDQFAYILNTIAIDNNIGEISTILMIRILKRCTECDVYSFMSDDNDARATATNVIEDLKTYNCFGAFVLLKQNGLTKQECKEFINSWKKVHGEKTVTIRLPIGKSLGLSLNEFLDSLYKDEYEITRNGFPLKK